MTCIIGQVGNGVATMVSDRATQCAGIRMTRSTPKISDKGTWLLATSGSMPFGESWRRAIHRIESRDPTPDEIFKACSEFDQANQRYMSQEAGGMGLLVHPKHGVFKYCSAEGVHPSSDLSAIGSGLTLAIAAVHARTGSLDPAPQEDLVAAIRTAAALAPTDVGPPFDVAVISDLPGCAVRWLVFDWTRP